MKKVILVLLYLLPAIYLTAQENKWETIILDEVLTISLPVGFTQQDTTIIADGRNVHSRIIQATTETCNISVSIDSINVDLKIHDRRSAYISLEGVAEGACIRYSQAGYRCERSDTLIDKIPGKRILLYENKNDLVFFCYAFRGNNKTYKIFSSISNNPKDGLRPSDLNKLLASIKFNSANIKEYKFYSEPESSANKTGFKISRIIIPAMIISLLIIFIIKKFN
jgi:hypothetical protein